MTGDSDPVRLGSADTLTFSPLEGELILVET